MSRASQSGRASVVVTPANVVPRQTVTATVTTDGPIGANAAARLDWGYVNFGTDTEDWVSVTAADVPVTDGSTATFRIPSWAPPSSPVVARWECRLTIDGGEPAAGADFDVSIGTADVEAYTEPLEAISGAAETVIDLTLASPVCRAGEAIVGEVILIPTSDLSPGHLSVSWLRERESHPLARTPDPTELLDGPIIELDRRIPLREGVPVRFPFAIPLPADAPPTAAAVHSSINWDVQARLTYAESSGYPPEHVRRPIVVVNAP